MPRFLLLPLFLAVSLFGKAQDTSVARNAIYPELGGEGMILSVNYDRRFTHSNDGFGFRVRLTSATLPACWATWCWVILSN